MPYAFLVIRWESQKIQGKYGEKGDGGISEALVF